MAFGIMCTRCKYDLRAPGCQCQFALIEHNYRPALIQGPFRQLDSLYVLSYEGLKIEQSKVYNNKTVAKDTALTKINSSIEYHQRAILEYQQLAAEIMSL